MSGVNQSFTVNSVGNTTPETINLGFKPKVMFSMGAVLNSFSTSFVQEAKAGFGWTADPAFYDATSVGSGGYLSVNNFAGNVISESLFAFIEGNTNLHGKALDVTSFNCDTSVGHPNSGFSWIKTAGWSPMLVPMIALGGNNIEVFADSFAWPSAAGDVVVTGVGFEPQLVMFLWGKVDSYNFTPFPITSYAGVSFGMGAASSADLSEQFAFYNGNSQWFGNHYASSAHMTGKVCVNVGSAAVDSTAFLASMDSDGFTVTFDGAATAEVASQANRLIGYIALRDNGGGQFHVGNETARTSNGTSSYTGCGFAPDQVIVGHGDVPTANTWYDHLGSFGLGMFDDTLQASILNGESLWPSNESARRLNDTAVAFGDGSGNLTAEAARVSVDSGGFTLDWTTTDGTAYPWGYIALKTTGGNTPCGPAGFIPQIYRWLKR